MASHTQRVTVMPHTSYGPSGQGDNHLAIYIKINIYSINTLTHLHFLAVKVTSSFSLLLMYVKYNN